jgi:hypothetical protein
MGPSHGDRDARASSLSVVGSKRGSGEMVHFNHTMQAQPQTSTTQVNNTEPTSRMIRYSD